MSNQEPPAFQHMTPETLDRIRPKEEYLGEGFIYGNNWHCTAAWYKANYPGFTDDQCKALELWSSGIRAKEYRQQLKKQRKKDVQNRTKE